MRYAQKRSPSAQKYVYYFFTFKLGMLQVRENRLVTSLGHKEREEFSEGPKFFKLCPTHFSTGALPSSSYGPARE